MRRGPTVEGARDAATSSRIPATAPLGLAEPIVKLDGKIALALDDAPDLLDVLAWEFTRRGVEMVRATSVAAACQVMHERPVDFVLADVHMHDGGGLELVRRLAAQARLKAPLWLMSGFDSPPLREAMALGATGVLV